RRTLADGAEPLPRWHGEALITDSRRQRMSIQSWFHKNVGKVCIAALALVTCMIAPLGASGSAAAPAKASVTLTFWTWVPNIQTEVNLFQQAHPGIKVHVINAGQGAPEYTKLRTALKA